MKAKICGGNTKLGNIGTWSTLFGNEKYSINGLSAMGTCGHHCIGCKNSCYVRKSYRYSSVVLRHMINTLSLQDLEELFGILDGQLRRKRKKFDIIRINQSGELTSKDEFLMWCKLASNHTETQFYVYTKAFEFIVLDAIPTNMTVLYSIWHEYGVREYLEVANHPRVKAFVYMDGFDYKSVGVEVNTMCKAYDENGVMNHNITCDKCRKCIDCKASNRCVGCFSH